ncbi:MAG TPA: preprotein translocase subunit SecG [Oscillospiraceae bacterium]|nr:preprotein translocase subunit SecG [Oscillospiraceae bacterium]
MSVWEIVSGVLLLISSIFIVLVTLLQESKQQGMTSAIGGGSNDSFYGKNSGRSREAKLAKMTTVMAIIFFIVTLVVNLVPVFIKK